jgi:hypothetical protein
VSPVIGWILGIVVYVGMLWFFITEFGTLLVDHIKQSRAYTKREQELRLTKGARLDCSSCPHLKKSISYPKYATTTFTIRYYCRKFKISVYDSLQPCQAKNPDEAMRTSYNKQEVTNNEQTY